MTLSGSLFSGVARRRPMAAAVASDRSTASHPAASSQCGRQACAVAAGMDSSCSSLGIKANRRLCGVDGR